MAVKTYTHEKVTYAARGRQWKFEDLAIPTQPHGYLLVN